MNTLKYELFLEVARELNFTKAAKNKFMTQQALSYQIINLEKEYGTELFERTTPLKLTNAGRRMVVFSNQLLELEHQIKSEIHDIKEETIGELHIGVGRERGEALRYVLEDFYASFPGVTIICHDGFNSQLSEKLLKGEIELFISSKPIENIAFQSDIVAEDWLALIIQDDLLKKCCPNNYEYIISNKSRYFPYSMFQHCPLMLTSNSSKTRQIAEHFFHLYNYQPKVMLVADYTESVMSFLYDGVCSAICFANPAADRMNQLKGIEKEKMHILKIDNLSKRVPIYLTYDKRKYCSMAQKHFMTLVKETLPQHYVL